MIITVQSCDLHVTLPQAMNMQEELSERVQELEEELAMALTEVKRTKDISKRLNEVR